MIDLKFIRNNTELVQQAVADRQDSAPIDEILKLDASRRQKLLKLEDIRRKRKEISKERKADAETEGRQLRTQIKTLEEELRNLEGQLEDLLLRVPNIPHPSVPVGKDENDNIVVRSWGKPKSFDLPALPS